MLEGSPEGGRVKSAPYDTDEARSLLQVRLAQFGKIGMLTGLLFLVLSVIVAFTLRLEGAPAVVLAQCGSTSVGALLWLAMRRGTYKTETLHAMNFVATLATCSVFLDLG